MRQGYYMVGGELLQASAEGEQDEYHSPHPSALSLSTQTATTLRWDLGMLWPLFIVRSLLKSVKSIKVFRPGKQLTLY